MLVRICFVGCVSFLYVLRRFLDFVFLPWQHVDDCAVIEIQVSCSYGIRVDELTMKGCWLC